MSRRRTLTLTILFATPLLGCASAPRLPRVDRAHEAVVREVVFAPDEIRELEIHAHQGHVVIRHGDTPYCRLDAQVVAGDPEEAERLAAGIALSMNRKAPGTASLGLEPGPGLRLDDVHGRWEIRVPAAVRVRVASIAADVTIRGAQGDVEVRTISGRVRARMDGGELRCATVDSTVDLDGEYAFASVTTDRGTILVDLPRRLAQLEDLVLVSDRGEVRVRAPRDERFRLEFATESGLVLSELPVRWAESSIRPEEGEARYRGTVGAGDAAPIAEVRVLSESADLRVEERPAEVARHSAQ